MEGSLRDLMRACRTAATGGRIDDALSSSILTVMGSAPVFATAESMVAASQAQSQLLISSVANQQRQNLIGMLATAGCVTQLLELGDKTIGGFDDIIDDIEDDTAPGN